MISEVTVQLNTVSVDLYQTGGHEVGGINYKVIVTSAGVVHVIRHIGGQEVTHTEVSAKDFPALESMRRHVVAIAAEGRGA
jgi:hypothetical protein